MKQYSIADAKEIAVFLLRFGANGGISFATHYETNAGGEILESSLENWMGATIVKQFDGYCLLVSSYGGGTWLAYDIAGLANWPTLGWIENALNDFFDGFDEISGGKVCLEMPSDSRLEEMWDELTNIPFDETDVPGVRVLSEYWRGFPKGTGREIIWRFFDEHHSQGVKKLLYRCRNYILMEVSLYNHEDPEGDPLEIELTGKTIKGLKDELDEVILKTVEDFDNEPGSYRIKITFTQNGSYLDSDEGNVRIEDFATKKIHYFD